jgi:hypothetical protein
MLGDFLKNKSGHPASEDNDQLVSFTGVPEQLTKFPSYVKPRSRTSRQKGPRRRVLQS